MKKDLTKVNGCYCKELIEHINELDTLACGDEITFEMLQQRVLEIVSPAKYTAAKRAFINRLKEECFRKKDIVLLYKNAIDNGRNYGRRYHENF